MSVFSSLCYGVCVAAVLLTAARASAEPVEAEHTTVELIAETDAVVPGETLHLALRFDIERHWHVYWKNPGASGLPVDIDWDLPEGFEAGEIQWPAPERIEMSGLINYGHEEGVTLIVPVAVPADLETGGVAELRAEAFWLICKEVCLPGEASLALDLPVRSEAGAGPKADLFEAARERQPEREAPWAVAAAVDGRELQLRLDASPDAAIPEDLYFYAESEGVVDPNAEQSLSFQGQDTAVLKARLAAPFLDGPRPERIRGVLQSREGNWALDVALDDLLPEAVVGSKEPPRGSAVGLEGRLLDLGLPGWLALAFLGGVILNVMPCVLPVLSLKVFSLLKHSGQTRGQAFAHGLAYTVGVVLSFVALAGALFALRALGERIGWGFQLQDPGFVAVLTVLFFLFGLNLMGVFEIGARLVGADAQVSRRRDLVGSLGTGVLAAVVGAPCVGPFVGGVSGAALQASPTTGVLVFAMLGFGMAAPFLLLAIFPKLVGYLPKPGPWMEAFKQLMGFLLMAAVVFLLWVAGASGGVPAMLGLLVALLVAAFAAWIYGRWGALSRPRATRRLAFWVSVLVVAGATVWGVQAARAAYEGAAGASQVSGPGTGNWEAWSKERVEEELEAGNPVFVDFTATWCLICQVNKKAALRTRATTELFEKRGIVALTADWTRYDAAITDELERYGRSGVPLYLLMTPDGETKVLPQSLTHGIIRDAVETAL